MYLVLMVLFMSMFLVLVFLVLFLVSQKSVFYSEKLSPFECGFNPKFFFRYPFSIQFFLVALLFLMFDLELVLLYPFLMWSASSMGGLAFLVSFLFFLVLFLGLIYEWTQGGLEWSN